MTEPEPGEREKNNNAENGRGDAQIISPISLFRIVCEISAARWTGRVTRRRTRVSHVIIIVEIVERISWPRWWILAHFTSSVVGRPIRVRPESSRAPRCHVHRLARGRNRRWLLRVTLGYQRVSGRGAHHRSIDWFPVVPHSPVAIKVILPDEVTLLGREQQRVTAPSFSPDGSRFIMLASTTFADSHAVPSLRRSVDWGNDAEVNRVQREPRTRCVLLPSQRL